jgi:hypothetical protein
MEFLQIDDGGGWFVVYVSADNRMVVGRRRRGGARRRRDERIVLHADLFSSSELSVSVAVSFVRVVISTAGFAAVVGVLQRMREGDVVVFLLGVVFVELVGRVWIRAEEGSKEGKGGGVDRRRFGGAVLLKGSQVGRWGFWTRSRRPFILWRGLSL